MEWTLTLNGELPPGWLFDEFSVVGLVRSEYLFRRYEVYPDERESESVVVPYLNSILDHEQISRLWYRTIDVTIPEANVLRGVDKIYPKPKYDFMGMRGVRRYLNHPDALAHELNAVRKVYANHPEIGLVAPFVTTADELSWFCNIVRSVLGDEIDIASMIETPAAVFSCAQLLALPGVSHLIIGANDLDSLVNATPRGYGSTAEPSLALSACMSHIVAAANGRSATVALAGNLTQALADSAEVAGIDQVCVHYSDLPRVRGAAYKRLPDLGVLDETKQLTMHRIAEHNDQDRSQGEL